MPAISMRRANSAVMLLGAPEQLSPVEFEKPIPELGKHLGKPERFKDQFLTFTSKNITFLPLIKEVATLRTIQEIGRAVAEQRHALHLKQGYVAEQAGISQECLSRFERGRTLELGSRKLLAILNVLGMELSFHRKSTTGHAQTDLLKNTENAN